LVACGEKKFKSYYTRDDRSDNKIKIKGKPSFSSLNATELIQHPTISWNIDKQSYLTTRNMFIHIEFRHLSYGAIIWHDQTDRPTFRPFGKNAFFESSNTGGSRVRLGPDIWPVVQPELDLKLLLHSGHHQQISKIFFWAFEQNKF